MKKNIFIVILVMIVLGMGGYLVYDKVINKEEVKKDSVEKKEKVKVDEEEKDELITLDFDSSKSLNTKDNVYSANSQFPGMNVYLSEENGQISVNFSFDKELVEEYKLDTTSIDFNNLQTVDINGKVVDVFVGGFGQAVGGEIVLFLMDDGSVEYMPVYDAIKNKSYKSYGKIKDVEKVIKFVSSSAHPKNGPSGWNTVIAMRSDGTFYDLQELIPRDYFSY